ncbi:InlB B-repeat-containing protein [Bifidobacterium pseudocatenulatum]|uniref:InlB B-repeat-containing protein n=1 Tax=Bifidobacterium pseudocatenulatum TaxID=28026 RepID=UPI0032E043CF
MRRHGAKQGNRMDYRMARHAAARHTGMRSVRRIAAAALGLALSLAGLSAQSVAFGNDDPTNPAATDVTMIAFQQSWKTIGDECTKTYGPEGVKYVQVSPPQESIQGTQWWTVYQPVSYKLDSRFGTEDEFKTMISQCNAAGVQIVADMVLNHTTGHDVSWVDDQYGVAGTEYNGSYGRYPGIGIYQYEESGNNHQYGLPSGDFHTCKSNVSDNISDYTNADEVWNCRLSTMWDINTGSDRVQNIQAEYLAHLWEDGVRGFRIDSAKHMDPNDIASIKRKFMTKAGITDEQSFPWSQEVIYHNGESEKFAPERYEKNGQVTEFSYAYSLLKGFNGSITNLKNITSDLLDDADNATVFVSNWDTARGSETLKPVSGARYELANAFMLGYGYGHPKILSDYAFNESTQYDDGVKDSTDTTVPKISMDGVCATQKDPTQMEYGDWNCQQRWTSIRGMIKFHNAVNGTSVSNWQESGSNNIAFERADANGKSKGLLALNNTLQEHDVDYTTSLPDGEYCNVYASRTCSQTVTVSGGHAKATIGKRSAIAIYAGAVKGAWTETTEPSGTYAPQYKDSPNSSLIGDKTLTIYYKPDKSWDGQVYVRYTSDNGSGSIAMSAVDVADSTNAAGWYKADLPEGANLSAVKYHFASTQSGDSDSTDWNGGKQGTEYTAHVGATMINVSGHRQQTGVPYTRNHAAKTKVTVNFRSVSGVGENASGVKVWNGDDMESATYIPFESTPTQYGRKASGELDGDLATVHFRIVDGADATGASAGTAEQYEASVWKLAKFGDAHVSGAIEAWVDGAQPDTASDRSLEKASPSATPQPNDIKNPKNLTIKLHYYRPDGNYQEYSMESDAWKGWDLWSWYAESTSGKSQEFTSHDEFGEVAEYTLSQTAKGVRNPWFIIRNGGSSWTGKDCDDNDREIPESVISMTAGNVENGVAEFWIVSGDPTVYTHPVNVAGITFDTQGGSSVPAQAVAIGGTASVPETPTRDGYVFSKWTTDVAGEHEYDFATTVSAPITLYAQWTEAKTVTFDVQGGSEIAAQQVQTGKSAVRPENPERVGYAFAGWYTSADTSGSEYDFTAAVNDDVTLYAKWTPNMYAVTFDSQGGSAVDAQQVAYGGYATQPATPTRDGYTFVGWTTDAAGTTPYGFGMPVTGGITLYAKWDDAGATYHTVTIHWNDGDDYSSDLPQDMTLFVKEGEKLTIPDSAPSRGGYRFAGLTSDEQRKTDYDAGTAVTADMTLYAKWVKTWTVTFDTAGGSAVNSQTVDDGGVAVAPDPSPTRDDCRFTGWQYDGKSYDFGSKVTGDITLTAQWVRTAHQWTITFDLNGGHAPAGKDAKTLYAERKVYDGDSLVSPTADIANEPQLDGYTFEGWSTVKDDALAVSVVSFDSSGKSLMPIDRDGTLYALWSRENRVVKPESSGSTGSSTSYSGAYSDSYTGLNGLAAFDAIVRQSGKFSGTNFGSVAEDYVKPKSVR